MSETTNLLDQLAKWNETLWGMPGGVLTFIFVAVLAVTLKWWKFFPNDQIPRWTILIGIGAFFCLAAPRGEATLQLYIGKNIIVGFIISALSVAAVLKFGSRLPVIGKYIVDDNTNTDIIKKP